jgi:hypothetical protein
MTPTMTFVGIDIAKANFVVACSPDGTSWTAPNDAPGIYTPITTFLSRAAFQKT